MSFPDFLAPIVSAGPRPRAAAATLLAALLSAFALPGAGAQCWNLKYDLHNSDTGPNGQYFGWAVALEGRRLLVGAPQDSVVSHAEGAAHLFDAPTGMVGRTFNNPTPSLNDRFGSSVAISGNLVVVGAPRHEVGITDSGGAYLFDAGTGALLHTYEHPDPHPSDYFGEKVAISGNNVLVAASFDAVEGSRSGSVHLFDAVSGSLLHVFADPTPWVNDYFGSAIAIEGNTILIGAYQDDLDAANAGAAYLFDAATGDLVRRLPNPVPVADTQFGLSAAISGDHVLVGSLGGAPGFRDGGAHLFKASTGEFLRTFSNPDQGYYGTPGGDRFASAVAISGNTVLVGARFDDTAGRDSGSVYLFDAVTGALLQDINRPHARIEDQFGQAVAISGTNVFVGAYLKTSGRGRAFLFTASLAGRIRAYRLGQLSDSTGLDVNRDGAVDIADYLQAIAAEE